MKKNFKPIVILLFLICFFCNYCTVFADESKDYKNVIEKEIEISAEVLNIRTGPGTSYPIVGSVRHGEKLAVIGTLGNWYIVILNDNSIGVISNKYTKVTKFDELAVSEGDSGPSNEDAESEKTEAEKIFYLANQSRLENGLQPFIWDEKINRIAEIKAEDMVNNEYFSHNSKTYGTPFAMLKDMGILYKSASENIARNNSAENAHLEMMNSLSHRMNILSARYNKMGVGVEENEDWGKIIVQLFIEE